MKKAALFCLIILTCTISKSFGQKIEKNKIDDFTNVLVKRTSWENLFTTLVSNAYFRISLIGDEKTFDLKFQDGTKLSVYKDQEIMFKLADGEVISLQNTEYTRSCDGCGAKGFVGSTAQGIEVSYLLTPEQAEKLKNNKVLKVRIETNQGYIESNVKDKNAKKIQKALNLMM